MSRMLWFGNWVAYACMNSRRAASFASFDGSSSGHRNDRKSGAAASCGFAGVAAGQSIERKGSNAATRDDIIKIRMCFPSCAASERPLFAWWSVTASEARRRAMRQQSPRPGGGKRRPHAVVRNGGGIAAGVEILFQLAEATFCSDYHFFFRGLSHERLF